MDNETRNQLLRKKFLLVCNKQKDLSEKVHMSKEYLNSWAKGKKDMSDKSLDKMDDLLTNIFKAFLGW